MGHLEIELDRSSPVPLYFQVAEQISEAIRRGDLAPGSRLDNEILLADRLGLSRPTVRQAIQYLVDKGLLVRKRGVGTQVVHGQVKRSVELTSLYDDLRRAGQKPSTRVLSFERVSADEAMAETLGLEPGTELIHIQRLRYASGEPLAILRNWLPAGPAQLTAEALEEHGLYELLRAAGIRLRVANQRIGAKAASAAEARLLGERRGAPLLTMVRTAYDDQGKAVEHGSHVYRASHYSLEVTLIER
ncbi:GntR family transcriptional regulator [Thermobispora bispora]|uniref:GntR family transcriptional regulator n=1 Tax=Thermobispora bispora TaxID=2006 RepID=UPI00197EFD72|nr:GntR family transcriptional regulator [Thermobispora bispora]MBO2475256.1 GntR family transcriptional regulator [Actinomycetales bacterium]MBX6167789.1 GntR family transcriptional regulator [Thermobispora bispora]MDI9581621.1 GntR family transcriptional regulator [Thermobispora sp.]QSI48238.1 GntR family transcriptional regulator [Thermobispora bispora]